MKAYFEGYDHGKADAFAQRSPIASLDATYAAGYLTGYYGWLGYTIDGRGVVVKLDKEARAA